MNVPYSAPDPAGSERARAAKAVRDLATEVSRQRPQALTRSNREEADHDRAPANFTKGLAHNGYGILAHALDYSSFVEAINSTDRTLFDKLVQTAATRVAAGDVDTVPFCCEVGGEQPKWRGWESPRAGHVYELEGPDAGSCGMSPAPRVGSSELAAEMAEVYALALLRDVPFSVIAEGGDQRLCPSDEKPSKAHLDAERIVKLLRAMPFYSGEGQVSSTPPNAGGDGYNRFERNRRNARTRNGGKLTPESAFRGSTKGAHAGPYLSQFLLVGADSIAGPGTGKSSYPKLEAQFDVEDGFIPYGSIVIDQRAISHLNCLDYMTDWGSWLDVQNGANFAGADQFEAKRRFITTPRDLATYVHYDALYEAYLNACLILLSVECPKSKGFPEPSPTGHRTPFATFGGPHILSLVTEVATRCLKAVRRQKFNYHRRARPEAIGGRLTLACLNKLEPLGNAGAAFDQTLQEMPSKLRTAIAAHNKEQEGRERNVTCGGAAHGLPPKTSAGEFDASNLLLPMAFPEGSPMHPAYGAGHATVAGGCITMLKSFFEMFEDNDSSVERVLRDRAGNPISFVPKKDGSALVKDGRELTIQGELDKLAANISIGRNMAGVHYYSDYYDSLRMGERIAVGILLEQAPTYGDGIETRFTSFDGDEITISGEAGSCPSLSILSEDGDPVTPSEWWLRHVSGQEPSEDLGFA